jgi:hypothetical protein
MDEITAEFKTEDIKKKAQEVAVPEPEVKPHDNLWVPFWIGFATMIAAGGVIVWMWMKSQN